MVAKRVSLVVYGWKSLASMLEHGLFIGHYPNVDDFGHACSGLWSTSTTHDDAATNNVITVSQTSTRSSSKHNTTPKVVEANKPRSVCFVAYCRSETRWSFVKRIAILSNK
jgi:hypothetical protein